MVGRRAALGVALAGLAALATAGPASGANFTAAEYPAVFEAGPGPVTQHVVTLAGGRKLECSTTSFSGELQKASPELTVNAAYGGCFGEFFGVKRNATVTMGGCDYLLTANTATEGSLSIKCEKAGEGILVDVDPICQYRFDPQGPVKGLTFKNLGGTAGIQVTINLAGLKYTRTFGTATNCGAPAGEATYTGASIFTAVSGLTSLPIASDVN